MKKGYSEIIFVLDESGSMSGLRGAVVEAFNSFVRKQKECKDFCRFTLVKFDDEVKEIIAAEDLQTIKDITLEDYIPSGITALYDAIGMSIIKAGNRFESMYENERPEKVIVVIYTDGEENSSREYRDVSVIKNMIEEQKTKYSWEIVFMASNIDVQAASMNMGINLCSAAAYDATPGGILKGFQDTANATYGYRNGSSASVKY